MILPLVRAANLRQTYGYEIGFHVLTGLCGCDLGLVLLEALVDISRPTGQPTPAVGHDCGDENVNAGPNIQAIGVFEASPAKYSLNEEGQRYALCEDRQVWDLRCAESVRLDLKQDINVTTSDFVDAMI